MLDTNVWSTFTDSTDNSGKAEYAIGGPTLDLFCASYNQKYPSKQIQYQAKSHWISSKMVNRMEAIAYAIGGLPTNDSLYVIRSTSKAQAHLAR